MVGHLKCTVKRCTEPKFSWQISSISYNPPACFASSFYTLHSTVELTLPVLLPFKPLTTSFMPVWANLPQVTCWDYKILTSSYISPASHTNLTNPRTYCFQYQMHESNLHWVWLGVWYWKWGCLGFICENPPKALYIIYIYIYIKYSASTKVWGLLCSSQCKISIQVNSDWAHSCLLQLRATRFTPY